MGEFLARYQQTETELQAYVAGLPLWVNVWRAWMFFVFTAGIVFVLHKREARWLGLTMIVSLVAYNLVSMATGVGRFPSIAFVVLWTPLALYLARQSSRQSATRRFDRLYGVWLRAALATLVVSLAFDIYNVFYSLVWV